jgi:hypothetical protein
MSNSNSNLIGKKTDTPPKRDLRSGRKSRNEKDKIIGRERFGDIRRYLSEQIGLRRRPVDQWQIIGIGEEVSFSLRTTTL